MRERTPRELAALIAVIVGLVSGLVLLIISYLSSLVIPLPSLLVFVGITFLLTFLAVFFLLERVINSKLNLIYRIIHGSKEAQEKVELNMSEEIFEKAQREAVKFAKESREEIERLKEQAEFRREFIGNLAHELKTPIFNLQGYLHTLLEGGLKDDTINEEYLGRADKNLDRLIELIKDIDTITKLESGADSVVLKKVDIVEICEDVLDAAEMKAKSKEIDLSFKKKYDPLFVKADPGKIHQVLTNLVINSINYGKEGGRTTISFHNVGENILVEVADDGLGISDIDQQRIFERFYRVEKSRDRHRGGSGLGLAIVKHIMEAHQQKISVSSVEGEGSTFSFTLAKA